MHGEVATVDVDKILDAGPHHATGGVKRLMWLFIVIGFVTFFWSLLRLPPEQVWGAFYVNVLFWLGLALGAAVTPAIFQIVRAKWSGTIRRVGEANSAFLFWGFLLWLCTWFGRSYLFPWAREPMPGREWWMQDWFVYCRFIVLFGFLFWLICRFVRLSLREDIGLARERRGGDSRWKGWPFYAWMEDWKGSSAEIPATQAKLSWNAPLIIVLYAVIYSLFSFEMVMGMDTVWYSNMFGGFFFVGNVYMGWCATLLTVLYLTKSHHVFASVVNRNQLWDLGKLMFGFCMLWGYLFFSQFLPQWYGNLPEETQWLILRTRDYPWKGVAWVTFACSFIIPFIVLISEDVKKTPRAISSIAILILFGVWLEKYVIVMPQLVPGSVPLFSSELGGGMPEIGMFLGFLGIYVLSIMNFLGRYPVVPVAHPLTHGVQKW